MVSDEDPRISDQSISEFLGFSEFIIPVPDMFKDALIREAIHYEQFAFTRHHYYSFARKWCGLGDIKRAQKWAKKLIDNFLPSKRLSYTESGIFNPMELLKFSIAFDPTYKQFAKLLIDCEMPEHGTKMLEEITETAEKTEDFIACADLWAKVGNKEQAVGCLEKIANPAELFSTEWLDCAAIWTKFNEFEKASKCLTEAENSMEFGSDLTYCADHWRSLNDEISVIRCIDKAIETAENWDDWSNIFSYLKSFGSDEKITKLLEKAIPTIKTIHDQIDLAYIYNDLAETKKARECLEYAEKMASESSDFADVAWAWSATAPQEVADKCLLRAEQAAKSYEDWQACFHQWVSFDDKAGLKRCLEKLEQYSFPAEYDINARVNELTFLASYSRIYAISDDWQRFLHRAEEMAEGLYDWHSIAAEWGHSKNSKAMSAAFDKAEQTAVSSNQWLVCAQIRADWGQASACDDCLGKAVAAAKILEDKISVADKVGSLKGYKEEFKSLERIENELEMDVHFINSCARLADQWALLNMSSSVKRLMDKAEKASTNALDLIEVAEKWNELGYKERAKAAVEKAETLSNICFEFGECSYCWSLLGEEDKAEGCIVKAEKVAKISMDYLMCAGKWADLDDEEGIKRCQKKAKETATICLEWIEYAKNIHDHGCDTEKLVDSLMRAVELAQETRDWYECWSLAQLCEKDVMATNCVKLAVEAAHSSEDWCLCANIWKSYDDYEKADAATDRAQAIASTAGDWHICALEIWFNDIDQTLNCLDQAMKLAKSEEDWSRLLGAWTALGEYEKAQICKDKL